MGESELFFLVLFAAFFHASWNALLKSSSNGFQTLVNIDIFHFLIAVVGVCFIATPHVDSWGYILVSAALHLFYRIALLQAYKYGDLSRSYPIARGVAPILVTCAAIAVGDALPVWQLLVPVGIIALGIMSVALTRGPIKILDKGLFYALTTGLFVASYSVTDALGVRLVINPIEYILWLFLVESIPLPLYALLRDRKGTVAGLSNYKDFSIGFLAGLLSILAYGIIIWAFSKTGMAQVVALRETSVVFAALIGCVILKEKFGFKRSFSAALTALGVVLLKVLE